MGYHYRNTINDVRSVESNEHRLCRTCHFIGKLLAAPWKSGKIQLWDVLTESLLKELIGHCLPIAHLAFSPDSEILASASKDNTVKLWNFTMGILLRTLEGHTGGVIGIAFAPENSRILTSASCDGTTRLWETDTGALLQTHLTQEGSSETEREVEGMVAAISSTHGMVVLDYSYWGTIIKIWDATTGALIRMFESKENQISGFERGVVIKMALSPDGRVLASIALPDSIRLWDITTGILLYFCSYHVDDIPRISFSPDGRILAVSDGDAVKLWDITSLETSTVVTGALPAEEHTNRIRSVRFSPDGKLFASSSSDTTIKLWDGTGCLLRTLEGHGFPVGNVTFSPNAETLVSVADEKTIKLWDVATGALLQILEGIDQVQTKPGGFGFEYRILPSENHQPIFSHDGKILGVLFEYTKSERIGRVRLWDTTTSAPLEMLEGDGDRAKESPFAFDIEKGMLTDRDAQCLNIFPRFRWRSNIISEYFGIEVLTQDEAHSDAVSFPDFSISWDGFTSSESTVGSNIRITIEGEWLIRGRERLIWLPHDRRAECRDRRGSKIILGHNSGLISYFHFKTPSYEI
ncbi:Beta-TrCP [Arthrobotrys entomopaga]|nr:Beta-TrCP [Arthrobotrys entomopaga]